MDKMKPDSRPTASAAPPETTVKDTLRDKCCLTCDASAFKDPTKPGFCKLKPPIVTVMLVPQLTQNGVVPGPQDFTLWPVVQPTDFCIEGYIAKGTERIPGIKASIKS